MTTIVNIRCRPMGSTLSRDACGRRHLQCVRGGTGQGMVRAASGTCAGCAVGAAHARGEAPTHWPDGERIAEVVHEVAGSVARAPSGKAPASPSYPREAQSRGERFVWGDRRLTAAQWAREPEAVALRLGADRIAARIRRHGWSVERAVTTPIASPAERALVASVAAAAGRRAS